MIIKAGLEQFDEYQGADPELLAVRETMDEPARLLELNKNPVYRMQIPSSAPLDFSLDFDSFATAFRTADFERVMMGLGTTRFYAWKSRADGKICF